ncbi:MAG: sensor histidine kinase [Acidobacteriota bacterium]|nr:sensor histidine kinase [Acidobacteriota bacterium]
MATAAEHAQSPAARTLRVGQHVLFATLLVIGVAQTIAEGKFTGWVLVTAVALALWYPVGVWLVGRGAPRRGGWAWFAVLAALWLVTVVQAQSFVWLMFSLCLLGLHLLPGVAGLICVLAFTSIAVWALWPSPYSRVGVVLGPAIGALVAIGMTMGDRMILAESAERGRLLTELRSAQADLVAVQEELATVQRETGALGERSRLARDIHDTLAQGYNSILLLARAGIARGASEADLLRQIEATAAENLVEARRVVHALAPAQLEDAPLPAAVRRLLDRLSTDTGVRADLEVAGDPRLASTEVDVAVLRLVQGALANVRQHAGASRVVVSLSYEPGELLVDVVDDGRGFDPALVGPVTDAGGFGLRAMRERLAVLGGSLSIESAPGEGTAVAASIPLEGGT